MMPELTLSQRYALGVAIALALCLWLNHPMAQIAISTLGLGAGFWMARQGEATRSAYVALAACAAALVFGILAAI
jgi:hypothetical protein